MEALVVDSSLIRPALLPAIEAQSQGRSNPLVTSLQLTSASPGQVKSVLGALQTRARVRLDGIEIKLSRRSVAVRLCCDSVDPNDERVSGKGESDDALLLFAAARLNRARCEWLQRHIRSDPSLSKMLARAHEIQARLLQIPLRA